MASKELPLLAPCQALLSQAANATQGLDDEGAAHLLPWGTVFQVLLVVAVASWFVYVLIQININPIGRIPPAYVIKGPIALDIGGSNAKMVYFRPPNLPRDLKIPNFARKDAANFVPIPKHMHFFPQNALSDYSVENDEVAGTLCFIKMPTRRVGKFVDFVLKHELHKKFNPGDLRHLNATGGGAFKFGALVRSTLGITLIPKPEMECLIRGLNFLLHAKPDEVFKVDLQANERMVVKLDKVFPYMVVNIGSGISILKVIGQNRFKRISGTSIGGGTFWGLAKLLTDIRSWDDINDLTLYDGPGDNKMVDLLVGDIYGGRDIPDIGLSRNVIASSFGKAATCDDSVSENSAASDDEAGRREARKFVACESLSKKSVSNANLVSLEDEANVAPKIHKMVKTRKRLPVKSCARSSGSDDSDDATGPESGHAPGARHPHAGRPPKEMHTRREQRIQRFKSQDIVKSLFYMISNNIGQLAYLNAKLYQCSRIFFCGGFVQDNPYVWARLTYAIQFWSKSEMEALFLAHDGYLGALGALLAEQ